MYSQCIYTHLIKVSIETVGRSQLHTPRGFEKETRRGDTRKMQLRSSHREGEREGGERDIEKKWRERGRERERKLESDMR